MTRILVLTAGFGDGHNTAAYGVQEALEQTGSAVRVEVVDMFRHSYGMVNSLVRHAYHGLINQVPRVWGGMFWLLDRTAHWKSSSLPLRRAAKDLQELISQTNPDCILTTYAAYPKILETLYPQTTSRPFLLGVVVTDSITVNALWHAAPADFYCVPNPETAEVLRRADVAAERIHAFGFPVSPRFRKLADAQQDWEPGGVVRVLYVLNHGMRKAVKTVRRLLKIPQLHLTVVTGRNVKLRRKLEVAAAEWADRISVLGWTDRMPELMHQSHLVVTKAGGATVQEALAAGRPVVVTQVIPGQEEGNAELVRSLELGAVAEGPKEVARLVVKALKHRGYLYRRWRRNVERHQRPEAAFQLARFVLDRCKVRSSTSVVAPMADRAPLRKGVGTGRVRRAAAPRGLLCDFHVHSTYSDGRLALPEVVSFYGRQGFDVLCLTDHIADRRGLIGRIGERLRLTLSPSKVAEYFDLLERERRRAWNAYGMLLLTGLEFNKEGFTAGASAHLLGLDLQSPIDPALPLPDIMDCIHQQNGLVVAPHPHRLPQLAAKNTLHLWHHRHRYRPQIDAWEIANRNHIFSPVGLEGLPFIASSDFHQPAHIKSWKTLLFCEKDPEAIKECIRRTQDLALVYYSGPGQLEIAPSASRMKPRLQPLPADPANSCASLSQTELQLVEL